ncbi:MAG: FAD/NAD(P)-binding protein [Elusimicrobia bacterium]|nr:FAD/NAD(P)-binding protein [Elusimicrobiota bacterium]
MSKNGTVAGMDIHGTLGKLEGAGNIFLPRKAAVLLANDDTPIEKRLTLRLEDDAPFEFSPGQFIEVSLFGYGEIPVGLASSPTRQRSFDIVVRAVGRVSKAIHGLHGGDTLHVRGPYGNGFDLDALRGKNVLIIAGGLGLAPTRSLIQYILDKRDEFKRFTLFYGTRDPNTLLFPEDLEEWRESDKVEYFETVDRATGPWKGNVGVVTTLFQKTKLEPGTKVVVCGPPIMFKFVLRELDSLAVPHQDIYLDVERRMKCGVGKCGHCQINDKYTCTDGPVFTFAELEKLPEAF